MLRRGRPRSQSPRRDSGDIQRRARSGSLPSRRPTLSVLSSLRQRRVAIDPALSLQLILAVSQGDMATAERLAHSPHVDLDTTDYDGRTALHHAVRGGHVDCVRLLVGRGARINVSDHQGRAPILDAQAAGADALVAYLRSHGAIDSTKWIARKALSPGAGRRAAGPPQAPPRRASGDGAGTAGGSPKDRDEDDNKESTGQQLAPRVFSKLAALASLPFVVLLLLQGSWFLFVFLVLSAVWFFFIGAFLVSEVSIRPPWYDPTPCGELSKSGLPEYWQGIYTNPRYDLDLHYDSISFRNDRGQVLRGWWVPAAEEGGAPPQVAVVMVHGGGRDRRAWLRHVRMFNEEGLPCLLFDFREHGVSDGSGKGFTYGAREKYDVLSAVAWAREAKGAQHVVVIGTSVGGSAVILAAARDVKLCARHSDRTPTIDAVIAENPLSKATELQSHHFNMATTHYLKGGGVGSMFLRSVLRLFDELSQVMLRIRIGIFPWGPQPVDVVGTLSPVPLLLMHGTGDDVIPHQQSEQLFRLAREPKELWMAPDAFHCGLYDRYPQEFRHRVFSFIRRHLPPHGSPPGCTLPPQAGEHSNEFFKPENGSPPSAAENG